MTATRILLALAGIGVGCYGAVLLLELPTATVVRVLTWAVVAVVIHDLAFAPLCAAVGLAGGRLLPSRWRSPLAVAALCSVVLVLLAVPVYGKPGLRPDNPTVLDRDYPLGLLSALAVVWLCVPVYLLLRRLPVRQNQVVDRQGAHGGEREPPTV